MFQCEERRIGLSGIQCLALRAVGSKSSHEDCSTSDEQLNQKKILGVMNNLIHEQSDWLIETCNFFVQVLLGPSFFAL